MIRFAYVFLLSFLLILAELLAESSGLRLLLFAPFVFYISYATDARTGCAAALLGGMVLDSVSAIRIRGVRCFFFWRCFSGGCGLLVLVRIRWDCS